MKKIIITLASLVVATCATTTAFAEGDAKKGAKVFRKCKACHMVGEKAKNRVGPVLNDVIGRTAGTAADYKYSKTNKTAGENGLVWTPENIAAYLPNPQKFLAAYLKEKGQKASGRTKMSFRLKKDKDIQNVIAFLKTHSPKAETAATEAPKAESTTETTTGETQ